MSDIKKISIFSYNDFRLFLRDFLFEKKKNGEKGYTLRSLSKKLGFNSPSFIKYLIEGSRNISTQNISKLTEILDFNAQEKKYFESLVSFNQSKTSSEKDFYFQKLLKNKKRETQTILEKQKYKYFSKWYNAVVRELLITLHSEDIETEIARSVIPHIGKAEITTAIKLLNKLELVKKDKNGKWVQTNKVITAGEKNISTAAVNFQKQMLELAIQAFDNFRPDERDIHTLTLRISNSQLSRIKEKIKNLKNEILNIAIEDEPDDRIIQVNFSVFPLSKKYFTGGGNK